ncbi:MAG: sulfite exporter TauE/SafE family protein [Holosporales bacterium]|jgi:uncharacterized membrane protein YfcA|nr:sulfite exporter TauE/SafE family protein [Holosporales bacterium]
MFRLFFPVIGSYFDPFLILSVGLFGGFLSGFLGVGSGIIITPILMELGIHPFWALSNQLCHAVGFNMTNFLMFKRKQDVDFHLASYILFGGCLGATCEWIIVMRGNNMSTNGTLSTFMYIYSVVLIVLGTTLCVQSIKEWRKGDGRKYSSGIIMRRWMLYLPFHRIFARSRTEMSVLIPIFVGFLAGVLVSALGGGDNLLMAPIITYLIGRISPVVNGTAALVGCVVTGIVSLIYACGGYCCDLAFVMILFTGTAIGSWFGVRLTYSMRRCYVNTLASVVIFLMAGRQIFKLMHASLPRTTVAFHSIHQSFLAGIAHANPIMYTWTCIVVVTIMALVFERVLQNIADQRQNKSVKK